jgi:hypothetical protein
MVACYLGLIEIGKRWFYRAMPAAQAGPDYRADRAHDRRRLCCRAEDEQVRGGRPLDQRRSVTPSASSAATPSGVAGPNPGSHLRSRFWRAAALC